MAHRGSMKDDCQHSADEHTRKNRIFFSPSTVSVLYSVKGKGGIVNPIILVQPRVIPD